MVRKSLFLGMVLAVAGIPAVSHAQVLHRIYCDSVMSGPDYGTSARVDFVMRRDEEGGGHLEAVVASDTIAGPTQIGRFIVSSTLSSGGRVVIYRDGSAFRLRVHKVVGFHGPRHAQYIARLWVDANGVEIAGLAMTCRRAL